MLIIQHGTDLCLFLHLKWLDCKCKKQYIYILHGPIIICRWLKMFITKKNIKQDIRSNNEQHSISFSTNSIDFKLLNSLVPYYKVRKTIYKGKNTDSLFIRVSGTGKNLIKLFSRYNKILKGLTYQEEALLKNIRKNSYITKKYNFDDVTLEDERELFKIYLPNEQVDYYDDYYNYNNQSMFYTKRINYQANNIKEDVVAKILKKSL